MLLTLIILFAGWIVNYYVGVVSDSWKKRTFRLQVSELVHPDILYISANGIPAEGKYCLTCHQGMSLLVLAQR